MLRKKVDWAVAADIKKRVGTVARRCEIRYIKKTRIFCFRSRGSKTRARARIWGLSRIWQQALKIAPAYILEVVSEKFDNLSEEQKDIILIHELLHIPKNFSGALLSHRLKGGVSDRIVREKYWLYKKNGQIRSSRRK